MRDAASLPGCATPPPARTRALPGVASAVPEKSTDLELLGAHARENCREPYGSRAFFMYQ